jgi:hypothetical protein
MSRVGEQKDLKSYVYCIQRCRSIEFTIEKIVLTL